MTPILILAAGQSSRMRGADKLLEPIHGVPLLRRQAVEACSLNQPVFVALPQVDLGRAGYPRADVLHGLAVTVLIVPEAVEGLSGTLRGAVVQLPPFDKLLLLLADLPEITRDDMAQVLAAPNTAPDALIWRGATAKGEPGHPILFDGSLRDQFANLHGDTGGEAIVKPLRDRTHLVPLPGNRARLDLDTPEDWALWRAQNA